MTCEAFLSGFSAYLDGECSPEQSESFDVHLEGCDDCRRYRDVMLRSLELVRALDPPTPSETFNDRLNARLYVEDQRTRATGPLGSGTTSGTTLVMTLLFAAAAWSPTLDVGPFGDGLLDGVEVASFERGSSAAGGAGLPTGLGSFSAGQITIYRAEELEEDLWSYPNAVFYAYSSLSRRGHSGAGARRVQAVGLQ